MTGCQHTDCEAHVEVNCLTDRDDGPITAYAVDLTITCRQCGTPFRFLGTPVGLSVDHPTASPDGLELRCPISPGAVISSSGFAYYELYGRHP